MNNALPTSGCDNPINLSNTALVDAGANVSLLGALAPANTAALQLPCKKMLQPSGTSFFTTGTLELLLSKLPKQAREARRAPVTNNLLSVSVLCDAGCEVLFHPSGCEITYNGETIIRGW